MVTVWLGLVTTTTRLGLDTTPAWSGLGTKTTWSGLGTTTTKIILFVKITTVSAGGRDVTTVQKGWNLI